MSRAHWTLALVALAAALAPAAWADLRAEIHLNYNGDRDFTYTVDLPASSSSDVESDPERTLRPHVEDAKKKLAIKQGYAPAIYGPEYYKLIRVEKVRFKVTDPSTSRVIAESGRGSG